MRHLRGRDSLEFPSFRKWNNVCVDDLGYGDAASSSETLYRYNVVSYDFTNLVEIWHDAPLPDMSIFMLQEEPQIAEPSANRAMNTSKTGFRPNTETRPPMRGSTAVDAIV